MAQTLIQVKDLKKYYNGGDVKALDGVTVDVYKGDVIAVIGPSGGGNAHLRLHHLRRGGHHRQEGGPPPPSAENGHGVPALQPVPQQDRAG